MVNRTAVILRYKEPFVRWINEADPDDDSPDITVEANEQNVYLIHQIEYAQDVDDWIELNYCYLFANELAGWYTDESMWPKNRTLELFREWVDVEYHGAVFDVVDGPLIDDEITW